MAVRCMNDKTKLELFNDMFDNDMSKAEAAVKYGVSTRTVGRVVDEMGEKTQVPSKAEIPCPIKGTEVTTLPGGPNLDEDFDLVLYDDDDDDEYDGEDFDIDIEDDEVLNDIDESYTYIMTPDSISITRILDDDVDTINIDEDHDKFEEVYSQIMINPRDQDTIKAAYAIVSIKLQYEAISNGTVTVIPEHGLVQCNINGYELAVNGKLASRLIEAAVNDDKEKLTGLMEFTDRLMDNPSPRAVNELYEFLEAADIIITNNGMIECFKKVTNEFKDCYTNKFDNSVGKIVSQPRFTVSDDSKLTCASGLHVCSYAYLASYRGSKIIKVLVDPADVVSIPHDYYSLNESGKVKAKARVCRYEVIEDVTEEYSEYAYGQ